MHSAQVIRREVEDLAAATHELLRRCDPEPEIVVRIINSETGEVLHQSPPGDWSADRQHIRIAPHSWGD